MSEKLTIIQVGGNIESAVKGDYQINVKDILTEAWQLTLKSRLAFNLGLIFVLSLYVLITLVLSNYIPFIKELIANPEIIFSITDPQLMQSNAGKIMLWDLLVTLGIWPFVAGIEMMGVLQAVGIKPHAKMTFSFLKRSSWVVICVLITSTLTNVGFELLIFPGIFLKITLSLTVPLVIEKKMPPMKAIILSIKVLRFKFFPILTLYLILFMSLVVMFFILASFLDSSVAPVGIALFVFGFSYLAPLFYNVKGVLYREIFGISLATNNQTDIDAHSNGKNSEKLGSGSDDTFSA